MSHAVARLTLHAHLPNTLRFSLPDADGDPVSADDVEVTVTTLAGTPVAGGGEDYWPRSGGTPSSDGTFTVPLTSALEVRVGQQLLTVVSGEAGGEGFTFPLETVVVRAG